MIEVDDALIDHLSHLAMLNFTPAEKQKIKSDLEEMIGFVDKLKELPTEGVAPLMHMTSNVNMFREDNVQPSLTREDALKNAACHDGSFFKVPKVIKK
jgi:aspartyl-tRNA(Asn)/glutamyl-tRNA(Gln) amidotransferase subunit C